MLQQSLAQGPAGVPSTKFCVPRVRADVLPRPDLVAQLAEAIDANPVTLVCAPGGAGKTTLLAQWAGEFRDRHAIVWLTLDAGDDDANRLFAVLLQAVESLDLTWEIDPRIVASTVAGTSSQTRAALGALVNALRTASCERIVLVFDDLHRLEQRETFDLLEALIERLPDPVTVVLGSRVEPPLPLARWRAYGELADFGAQALRFSIDDALQLAGARSGPVAAAEVQAALERTQGWVAGLRMLLQSRQLGSNPSRRAASPEQANRQLFAFLAEEILADLPRDLQLFLLQTSILAELSPASCAAVTGRADSAAVLDDLYRRSLFLTVVDESTPSLRLHDLFREFLEAQLSRGFGEQVAQLHEKAAAAESVPARRVHHLLKAERWEEALRLVVELGGTLLSQGGIATVERWLDQVPESIRATEPHAAYLRGTCAWLRWDWARARPELSRAVDGLTDPAEHPHRVRACFQLVDALTSSGDPDEARRRLDAVAGLPLDVLGQAELALQQAWCVAPDGDPAAVVAHLRDFVERAKADPRAVCPQSATRFHCILIGLRGAADIFGEFGALATSVFGLQPEPWHIAALAVQGWSQLWRGDRAALSRTLQLAQALNRRFGGMKLLNERIGHLTVLAAAAMGDTETAVATGRSMVAALEHDRDVQWQAAAWGRAYRHGFARMLWNAGLHAPWRDLAPLLMAPRGPHEWPFLDVAADLVRGQAALLDGDLQVATAALERAASGWDRFRMPQIYADPRPSLAMALLASGDRRAAWQAFEPTWREVVEDDAFGLLLLQPRASIASLLELAPATVQASPEYIRVTDVLSDWWSPGRTSRTEPSPPESIRRSTASGALASLSERELEVLARIAAGDSNKQIARHLGLSLHTVKRHVANILSKLDCASRGQASDTYHRSGTSATG